jgi:DNA-binding Xre family transcriptional regulator
MQWGWKYVGVSYRKLRRILFERRILLKVLRQNLHIGADTLSKINKDNYMSLETLEKIARFLDVNIGDIVELRK